jgi:hypothetical protein
MITLHDSREAMKARFGDGEVGAVFPLQSD